MLPYFKARVRIFIGPRMLSKLIRGFDLGMDGVGRWKTMSLSYKPDVEDVNKERVEKAIQLLIEKSNAEETEFEIFQYEILEIVKVVDE